MPYVSCFEDEFCKAFRDSLDALEAEPFEDAVKKMVDHISEAVIDRVHDDVRDRLISNISESICRQAAEVATRYLEEALAGDDKQIRALLGLYEYATAYRFSRWGPRPTRWLLIEAMMERRPDLFVDERIRLLNGQVEGQERDIKIWRERCHKAEAMIPPEVIMTDDGTMDLIAHIRRQREWSLRTFGPGDRTQGVIAHIRKELVEVEEAPADLEEWVDVIILAIDGAWRIGWSPEDIAAAVAAKQAKNERRKWPEWRTADPNGPIEHDREAL